MAVGILVVGEHACKREQRPLQSLSFDKSHTNHHLSHIRTLESARISALVLSPIPPIQQVLGQGPPEVTKALFGFWCNVLFSVFSHGYSALSLCNLFLHHTSSSVLPETLPV